MYQELIKPIAHLGATDTVTAAELRNCLSVVSAHCGGTVCPDETAVSAEIPAEEIPAEEIPAEEIPAEESDVPDELEDDAVDDETASVL